MHKKFSFVSEVNCESNASTKTDGSLGVQCGRGRRTRGDAGGSEDADAKYRARNTDVGWAKFVRQDKTGILRLKKDIRKNAEESNGGGEQMILHHMYMHVYTEELLLVH